MRIAMWSGPRNLSTAMMYAFGARPDCAVVDEPFYAAYLTRTGIDHPLRDEILASQPSDPASVAAALTGAVPQGRAHFYQKHMVHHMRDGFMPDWPRDTRHVFLIRHPARVVASYAVKREAPTDADLGFTDQWRVYQELAAAGARPLVIDSVDIRANPRGALEALCGALGLPFDDRMLSWPAGGHADDGVWARHWYGAAHRSTGFAGDEGDLPVLPPEYAKLAETGLEPYRALASLPERIVVPETFRAPPS
ncbi:sulfotransferase [Oceaniglobus trochenteri]|uniref:sulfotransferase n=1 Tax=Oceaniglobus trochenteri TaxID=2763260 RepID=UPI001CFFECB3|nr:sulfotransferase [Oceaniglobus trochenteri]